MNDLIGGEYIYEICHKLVRLVVVLEQTITFPIFLKTCHPHPGRGGQIIGRKAGGNYSNGRRNGKVPYPVGFLILQQDDRLRVSKL